VNVDGTESDRWALECKKYQSPFWQLAQDACRQAESAARNGQEPVVVMAKSGQPYKDALVIQRMEVFEQWRLGGGE